MLALLASALLHPLLLSRIPFPRPLPDWGGQALEVGLREAAVAPRPGAAPPPNRAAQTIKPHLPPPQQLVAEPPTVQSEALAAPPAPVVPVRTVPVAISAPTQTAAVSTPVVTPFPAVTTGASARPATGLASRALSQAGLWQDAATEAPVRTLHWRSGQPKQAYEVERYVEEWAHKVERVGNLNYPEMARRQRLSGALRLAVTLDADGRLLAMTVERSSGQSVLDQAAQHIVELAAPFAAFPPALRARGEQLVISREWNFSRGDALASQ